MGERTRTNVPVDRLRPLRFGQRLCRWMRQQSLLEHRRLGDLHEDIAVGLAHRLAHTLLGRRPSQRDAYRCLEEE